MLVQLKSLADRHLFSYFKNYPLLGLDLGLSELRYMALSKRGSGFHIEKLGTYPISAPALPEQLAAWVVESGAVNHDLALSVPGQAVIRKQIELHGQFTERELQEELKFRLCQHFPGLPEKDMQFDFVLRDFKEGSQRVLLAAVKKEIIQGQMDIFKETGLKVRIMDVDLYALARAARLYFYPDRDQNASLAGLIDLRWPLTSFLVFHQEDIIFHYQWRLEKPLLVEQISRVWQLFRTNHPGVELECLGLSGEDPDLEKIVLNVEQSLSLTIKIVNPFLNMISALNGHSRESGNLPRREQEIPAFAGMTTAQAGMTMAEAGPRFLLCCGLALRGL